MSGSPGRRRFALLGDPVAHSVSPAMHRAAFEALGLEARYELRRLGEGEVEEAMRGLARRGGGNVTLPHKGRAAASLDRASDAVRATGACNCFWGEAEGRLAGDNTDVEGFLAAAAELRGGVPGRGGRVLLLGAGGAARAVLAACLSRGAEVDLLNRTVERARGLARQADPGGRRVRVLEDPEAAGGPYGLAVNATSLGLEASDPLPFPPSSLEATAVLDLVYGPRETPWVRALRERGVEARDGIAMLVHQAALSLERWFPDRKAPREVMREAALRALGREAG